ncbi:hypothetical protein RN001_015611 [Aquatica leii]|uniref:RING-type E3 ubiquitin transferase n=1 Tax=Aquatica leii TaxID=1421715 RepID=A0AAN7SAQ8_9COLE|nr:hypothetical protein RN001_015611 [Aquatica leii]
MDIPVLINEETASQSSSKEAEDIPTLEAQLDDNAVPWFNSFDLEMSEINRLFVIIAEKDTETLNEIVIKDIIYDAQCRFRSKRNSLDSSSSISPRPLQIYQLSHESTYTSSNTARDDQFTITTLTRFPEAFRLKIIRNVIAFIDLYSMRSLSKQEDVTDKCIICVCHFELNNKMRTLNCSHKFHRYCIDEWLVQSYKCPLCRIDLMGVGKVYKGLAYLYRSNIWRNDIFETTSLPLSDVASAVNMLSNINSTEDEFLQVD